MSKTFNDLVSKCVVKNIVFTGGLGSAYTVQDLIHACNENTIDKLFQVTSKQLDELGTRTLRKSQNTEKRRILQLQVDTLSAVFQWKEDRRLKAEARAKARAQKVRLLEKIQDIKDKKTIEKYEAMSEEQLDEILESI